MKNSSKVENSNTEPKFDYKNLKKGKSGGVSGGSRSRSKSLKKRKSVSPDQIVFADPRQQIYEAKFEKYLSNK